MLPSGEKQLVGSGLTLYNVSRLDSGTFICTASNGVDLPVERKIELEVVCKCLSITFTFNSSSLDSFILLISDEPEIHVDKSWVHADVGVEIKISCVVYANPAASVSFGGGKRGKLLTPECQDKIRKLCQNQGNVT